MVRRPSVNQAPANPDHVRSHRNGGEAGTHGAFIGSMVRRGAGTNHARQNTFRPVRRDRQGTIGPDRVTMISRVASWERLPALSRSCRAPRANLSLARAALRNLAKRRSGFLRDEVPHVHGALALHVDGPTGLARELAGSDRRLEDVTSPVDHHGSLGIGIEHL